MTEIDDELAEEFSFAQAGAVAHLETMAQVARDAAEDATSRSDPASAELLMKLAEEVEAYQRPVSAMSLPANAPA